MAVALAGPCFWGFGASFMSHAKATSTSPTHQLHLLPRRHANLLLEDTRNRTQHLLATRARSRLNVLRKPTQRLELLDSLLLYAGNLDGGRDASAVVELGLVDGRVDVLQDLLLLLELDRADGADPFLLGTIVAHRLPFAVGTGGHKRPVTCLSLGAGVILTPPAEVFVAEGVRMAPPTESDMTVSTSGSSRVKTAASPRSVVPEAASSTSTTRAVADPRRDRSRPLIVAVDAWEAASLAGGVKMGAPPDVLVLDVASL